MVVVSTLAMVGLVMLAGAPVMVLVVMVAHRRTSGMISASSSSVSVPG